jgi:hypothetical protein
LIIFSTNLEPKDLVDEAFLRRIPYKIEITDPDEQEFQLLFKLYAESLKCDYDPAVVDWLMAAHYRPLNRAMRRCHPRDLLTQIRNYCVYKNFEFEMRPEHFDRVVNSYFTVVNGMRDQHAAKPSTAARPVVAPVVPQAAAPVFDRRQTEEMPSKDADSGPPPQAPLAPIQHFVTEPMPANQ